MALVAASEKVTLVPAMTVLLAGWVVMTGDGLVPVLAVSLMTLLLAVPAMVRTTVLLLVLPLVLVTLQ